MKIEHKTTHGPHSSGQLAADWMLETGYVARVVANVRTETEARIRLAVPAEDLRLTPESAAALKDALEVHLRNIGWDAPDAPAAAPTLNVEVVPPWAQRVNAPADVVQVAESIRDAYADNSRTIGRHDVPKFTDQEVAEIAAGLKWDAETCWWLSAEGIRYTPPAADAIRERAAKLGEDAKLADMDTKPAPPEEDQLASPVEPGADVVYRNTVRKWTDDQCRGAWNHAMEDKPRPGLLTDRPSGREYSKLATQTLRARLNEINGADAPR